MALNYGTQALLTTITALSVVTNAIIAKLVFDKPFAWAPPRGTVFGIFPKGGFKGWGGGACLLILVGVGGCATSAPKPPVDLLLDEAQGCPSVDVFRAYWEGPVYVVWFYIIAGICIFCLLRIFFQVTDDSEKRARAMSYRYTITGPPKALTRWGRYKVRARFDAALLFRLSIFRRARLSFLALNLIRVHFLRPLPPAALASLFTPCCRCALGSRWRTVRISLACSAPW